MQFLTLATQCLFICLLLINYPTLGQVRILPSSSGSIHYGVSDTYSHSSTASQPVRIHSTASSSTANKPYGISQTFSYSSGQAVRIHSTSVSSSNKAYGISETFSYSPTSSRLKVLKSHTVRQVAPARRIVPTTTNKSYGISETFSYKNGRKITNSKPIRMVQTHYGNTSVEPMQMALTLPMSAPEKPAHNKAAGAYSYAALVGSPAPSASAVPSAVALFEGDIKDIYYTADLGDHGLAYTVFKHALTGYYNLMKEGKYSQGKNVITIIDYRKPSDQKRFYVIDIASKRLLYKTWVSHGKNSGGLIARYFSDTPQSYQTSLGFYRTAEPYKGRFGYSMKLDGLEYGFNRNARKRSIVMHSEESITPAYTKIIGMLIRSFGCPAIPVENHREIINLIKNGSCLFMYSDDLDYLNNSHYLDIYNAASYYTNMVTGYDW